MAYQSPRKVFSTFVMPSVNPFWTERGYSKVLEFIAANPGPYTLEGITADELKLFYLVQQSMGMSDDGRDRTPTVNVGGYTFQQVHEALVTDKNERLALVKLLSTAVF